MSALLHQTSHPVDRHYSCYPGLPSDCDSEIALKIRMYDFNISAAWLALRLGKMDQFESFLEFALNLQQQHRVSRGVYFWTWLGGWHMLQLVYLMHHPETFTAKSFIEAFGMLKNRAQYGVYLAHDIDLIKERHPDLDTVSLIDSLSKSSRCY